MSILNGHPRYIGEGDRFTDSLDVLQERIGIHFEDAGRLSAALTHPSFWGEFAISEEERLSKSYERLEFLGDSVIALSVCSYLFEKFPANHQGLLSKDKGHLVSKKVLLRVSRKLGLDEYIRVGKGVSDSAGRDHTSFMVDCFEALVGAIYHDFGFERARDFVIDTMREELDGVESEGILDFKTTFQELVQKRFKCLPQYRLVSQEGPEHQKEFTVEVFVRGEHYGEGRGHSKKEAEMSAARCGLDRMGDESDGLKL